MQRIAVFLGIAAVIFMVVAVFPANAQTAPAPPSPYPIRSFVLDTKGYKLTDNVDNVSGNKKPTFTEVGGVSWRVKYSKKGRSRAFCSPPVMTLSFDKGNPLFNGMTTYAGAQGGEIRYQKIKLVPECEYWGYDTNVLLREYLGYAIMNVFGVPAPDVLGFANVKFRTKDAGVLADKDYRYLILQNINEKDDQIPFLVQRQLSDLVEDDTVTDRSQIRGNGFVSVGYKIGNAQKDMMLDPDTVLRYNMAAALIDLEDHGLFHNQNYAYSPSKGKYVIIPFDFDGNMACSEASLPSRLNKLVTVYRGRDPLEVAQFRKTYYSLARAIFDTPENLDAILRRIDNFPFDVGDDVVRVKNYLRTAFYIYALYYGSPEFAAATGQTYVPFTHENEYVEKARQLPPDAANVTGKCSSEQSSISSHAFKTGEIFLETTFTPSREGSRIGESRMTVSNPSPLDKTLVFPTTCDTGYVIHDAKDGAVVYDGSDVFCAPVFHEVALAPRSQKVWTITIPKFPNLKGEERYVITTSVNAFPKLFTQIPYSPSITEVSPFYSTVFSPSSGKAGDPITMYWRGAAQDIDTNIVFEGTSHRFSIIARSLDGTSLQFNLPTIPRGSSGPYQATAQNARHGQSGSRQFIITALTIPQLRARVEELKKQRDELRARLGRIRSIWNVPIAPVSPSPVLNAAPIQRQLGDIAESLRSIFQAMQAAVR
jgi:hypothetical protein